MVMVCDLAGRERNEQQKRTFFTCNNRSIGLKNECMAVRLFDGNKKGILVVLPPDPSGADSRP